MTATSPAPTTQRKPRLLGQTVVLIGGSSGIGLETARHARGEGAEVVLVGRDQDRLWPVALPFRPRPPCPVISRTAMCSGCSSCRRRLSD